MPTRKHQRVHQPGVEAGKKAAAAILELEPPPKVLRAAPGKSFSAPQLAEALSRPSDTESLIKF